MPERVFFEAGDPDDVDDHGPDTVEERIKHGKKLITVGLVTICLSFFMVLLFILLVTGAVSVSSNKNCEPVECSKDNQVSIEKDSFGKTADGIAVDRYTITNKNKLVVQLITFGARVTSIKLPDKKGNLTDVVLGFDKIHNYETSYVGGVLGRVANIISGSAFTLDRNTFTLNSNSGKNHLNGGRKGFDKYVWDSAIQGNCVALSRVSADGEERYPGTVHVNVTYCLTNDDELLVTFRASLSGRPSPVGLSNSILFNLAGEGYGDIYDHTVTIFADKYLPLNTEFIPTGVIGPVNGTPYDLREPVLLRSVISNISSTNFNPIYLARGPDGKRLISCVEHVPSGRSLKVYSNQPVVQFQTGNFLNYSHEGKNSHSYMRHSGFEVQTQSFPDAVHQPNFPDNALYEGSVYIHDMTFAFSTDR